MSAVNALIRVRPYLQAMASMDRAIGKPDVEVLNLLRIIDEAIAHPEPASEYDFSNVIHLTHHKAQHIIERDGYVLTGFVLTKNKEGREYSKCIVDMSAVRWFDDGMTFFRMMHAPTPLVWKVDSQSLERMAEESECVKLSLDKAGVATADENGDEYSLWGRVRLYANQAPLSEKTKEQVRLENDASIKGNPFYLVGREMALEEAAALRGDMGSLDAMEGEGSGSAAMVRVADKAFDLYEAAIRGLK
jgi:hypothetical protein